MIPASASLVLGESRIPLGMIALAYRRTEQASVDLVARQDRRPKPRLDHDVRVALRADIKRVLSGKDPMSASEILPEIDVECEMHDVIAALKTLKSRGEVERPGKEARYCLTRQKPEGTPTYTTSRAQRVRDALTDEYVSTADVVAAMDAQGTRSDMSDPEIARKLHRMAHDFIDKSWVNNRPVWRRKA